MADTTIFQLTLEAIPAGADELEIQKAGDGASRKINVSYLLSLDNATGEITTVRLADNSVTLAKMADVASGVLMGRATAGSGDPEALSVAQVLALLGVEAGSTADQSGAEIKSAYESEADTNAFTNALLIKLNAIAANANNYTHPNHTGEVTSAGDGALTITNSAVTLAKMANLNAGTIIGRITTNGVPTALSGAQVLTLLGVEAGATADQSGAEIKAAYITQANAFTDAKNTKLTNIESNADVTDAVNVGAAGAVMNSDFTAKGVIISATAVGLPGFLTIGANGTVLIADDSQALGMRWSAITGGGDMLIATYDPGGVGSDAFDMDNMTEGATNLILSVAERNKLTGIAAGANNYAHPNHSGEVTSVGDGALTIVNNVVTYGKLLNVPQNTIVGRVDAGTGTLKSLTPTEARTALSVAENATSNQFRIDAIGGGGTYGNLVGAVDGVNTVFAVSEGNYVTATLEVEFQGQGLLQIGGGRGFVETNPGTGVFTLDWAPPTGTFLKARYQYV